jgi:hypothetical protein
MCTAGASCACPCCCLECEDNVELARLAIAPKSCMLGRLASASADSPNCVDKASSREENDLRWIGSKQWVLTAWRTAALRCPMHYALLRHWPRLQGSADHWRRRRLLSMHAVSALATTHTLSLPENRPEQAHSLADASIVLAEPTSALQRLVCGATAGGGAARLGWRLLRVAVDEAHHRATSCYNPLTIGGAHSHRVVL